MNLIEKVKLELHRRDMKPADIAKRGGVSPSTVSRFLNGQQGVGDDLREALSKTFGVPLDAIYRWEGKIQPIHREDEMIAEILYLAEKMSFEEKQELKEYGKFMIAKRSKKNVGSTLVTVE